jgi:hypothetical protein
MMNTLVKLVSAALWLCLWLAPSASAAPVTVRFDLPAWTEIYASPATFGTNGVLTVTLDNGSASTFNQSYLNTTITSIALVANGGTFSPAFSGTSAVGSEGAELLSFISTDAAGIPTLDLTAQDVGSAYDFYDGTYFLQLGITMPTQGYWPFSVSEDAFGSGAFMAVSPRDATGLYTGLVVRGQAVAEVAEPTGLALVALGLMAVWAGRRRAG